MLWYSAAGASERLRACLGEALGDAPLEEFRFAFDAVTNSLRWQRTAPAPGSGSPALGTEPGIVDEGSIDVPPELLDECAERF